MKVLSHKIRLYPNFSQVEYFIKSCGTKRFAYNLGLSEVKKHYEEMGKTLSGYDLCKRLNGIKREEFPWMLEVTKWVPQKAVYQTADAFNNFFKKRAMFQRYKKRGKSKEFGKIVRSVLRC